jgi:hypothetical protein
MGLLLGAHVIKRDEPECVLNGAAKWLGIGIGFGFVCLFGQDGLDIHNARLDGSPRSLCGARFGRRVQFMKFARFTP